MFGLGVLCSVAYIITDESWNVKENNSKPERKTPLQSEFKR